MISLTFAPTFKVGDVLDEARPEILLATWMNWDKALDRYK